MSSVIISLCAENGEKIPSNPRNAFPETEFPGGWKRITLVIPENTLIKSGEKYIFKVEIKDESGKIIDSRERIISIT